MSKKQLTFLGQAEAIETENKLLGARLSAYLKLIDTAVKAEVGLDLKTIKKALEKGGESHKTESKFEKKICDYFNLYIDTDKEDFLRIMLTDSSRKYFEKKRYESDEATANQDSPSYYL